MMTSVLYFPQKKGLVKTKIYNETGDTSYQIPLSHISWLHKEVRGRKASNFFFIFCYRLPTHVNFQAEAMLSMVLVTYVLTYE